MRTNVSAIAVAMMLVAIMLPAQAQIQSNDSYFSPDKSFGFGVNNAGLHIQYAMNEAFHFGLNLNLDFQANQSTSGEAYSFGPYAKYIFAGDVIKPYIYGALGLVKPNTGRFDVNLQDDANGQTDPGVDVRLPDPEIRTYVAAGGEYFFNQNVGVYGHVNLVDAKLGPEPITAEFGLRGGVVGVEFFFD